MEHLLLNKKQEAAIENLLIDEAEAVRSHIDTIENAKDLIIELAVGAGRDMEALDILSDLLGLKNNLKQLVA